MSLHEKALSRRTFFALMGSAALVGSGIALAGCSSANEQAQETAAASTQAEDEVRNWAAGLSA